MGSEISERVRKYVESQSSPANLDNYLVTIRDNLKVMEDKFNKNFVMVLAFIAVFYLFSKSAVSEASVGPFKVKDVSIVYMFIPLLIAYKYYEINSIIIMRRLTRIIHLEMIKMINKPLIDTELEYFLLPTSIFLSNEISFNKEKSFVIKMLLPLLELSVQLGFTLFEIYAIYNIYSTFGISSLFWVVFISSGVFMLLGFFTLVRNAPKIRSYNIGSKTYSQVMKRATKR